MGDNPIPIYTLHSYEQRQNGRRKRIVAANCYIVCDKYKWIDKAFLWIDKETK
jgi:hypothetical protein